MASWRNALTSRTGRASGPCSRLRTCAAPTAWSAGSDMPRPGRVLGRRSALLLLGLYNEAGLLDHVGFTSALGSLDRVALTAKLEKLKGGGFTGDAPGGPSRWSTERTSQWVPVKPKLVIEVQYDHVTGRRFRHGTGFLRWRPDKAPRDCSFDQLVQEPRPSRVMRLLK